MKSTENDRRLKAPIILLGTHRSGTTMLGRAIAAHPSVAYWEEPRHVWSWRHNYRRDDRLDRCDVTPRIESHIHQTFGEFVRRSGKTRFAEKTPSNCLRLPFIQEVFPDAKFVHIVRDGRAVVHSALQMLSRGQPESRWFMQRLLGTPWWEWPAYLPRAYRTLGRRWMGKPMAFWGPRPPNWSDWVASDPHEVVLARQWQATVTPALDFGARAPSSQWYQVRYEDFVANPRRHMHDILTFLGLAPWESVLSHADKQIDSSRTEAWRDHLDQETLSMISSVIAPTLRRLGYASA